MGKKGKHSTSKNLQFSHHRGVDRYATGEAEGRGGGAAAAATTTLGQTLSDDSLDEQLLDYLQNINQEDSDTDESPQRLGNNLEHDVSNEHQIDETANSSMQPGIGNLLPANEPDTIRPGLGYQHGFTSTSAAVQFSAVCLDDALEGQLHQDMQQSTQGVQPHSRSTSSEGSQDSSSDTSSSDSRMMYHTSNLNHVLGLSEPMIVDAAGRPQQVWQDLDLQQRYPVQLRQDVAMSGGASSSGTRQQQQQPPSSSTQTSFNDSITSSMLVSSLPSPVPAFQSQDIASTVTTAIAAAAELAKQYVARYAVLAQQLQQAKQNHGRQPGKQGKGVKKQLKKAKVAAKRSARQSRAGSGALQLLAALEAFVRSGQDMQVLPPTGSKLFAQQLAGLFGVVASSQGGSKHRTTLVLQQTLDMRPELDADALRQLQQLLKAQLAVEMSNGVIARDGQSVSFKQDKKQKKRLLKQTRSSQGGAAAGQQGVLPVQAPDYQQPMSFVAAGFSAPASSTGFQDNSQPLADDRYTAAALSMSGAVEAAGSGTFHLQPPPPPPYNLQLMSAAHTVAAAGLADGNTLQQQQQQQQQVQQLGLLEVPYHNLQLLNSSCVAPAQASFGNQVAEAATTTSAGAAASILWGEDRDAQHALPLQHVGQHDIPAYGPPLHFAVEAPAQGDKQLGGAAPLYNRTGMGPGVVAVEHNGLTTYMYAHDLQEQGSGLPPSSVSQHTQHPAGSSIDHKRLAELESQFRLLQTRPDARKFWEQQEWQRQQQQVHHQHQGQQLEDEQDVPSISERFRAAAEFGAAQPTFNMTAQQLKKAKKKQQRDEKRERNRAAAAPASGGGQSGDTSPSGAASGAGVQNQSAGFASFEVHTSGIGSRLLSRWGWREGEGLGREGQGRAEPIQPKIRPRQKGLGFA